MIERVFDEHRRPLPPPTGDETATLLGFLDYQRATFAWKTSGLDATALNTTVAASTLTLGGLLKHLAWVELDWFVRDLHDKPWPGGPRPDPHQAWTPAPGEHLHARWAAAVQRARDETTLALAIDGLDTRAKRPWADGTAPSLRWILCHMIEEYARHNGHADLLREAIDGSTGE